MIEPAFPALAAIAWLAGRTTPGAVCASWLFFCAIVYVALDTSAARNP